MLFVLALDLPSWSAFEAFEATDFDVTLVAIVFITCLYRGPCENCLKLSLYICHTPRMALCSFANIVHFEVIAQK